MKKLHNNWYTDKIAWGSNIYDCEFKKFENGSEYGIDGGKVSKLFIKLNNKYVAVYDRGWSLEPVNDEVKKIVNIINV